MALTDGVVVLRRFHLDDAAAVAGAAMIGRDDRLLVDARERRRGVATRAL